MATIKWNRKARHEFAEYIRYARHEFGVTTAFKWYAAKNNIESQVSMFPESFPLESLLRHKQRIYRRAVLMKNICLLSSSDTVHIVDIWDTRMNPETLKQRL